MYIIPKIAKKISKILRKKESKFQNQSLSIISKFFVISRCLSAGLGRSSTNFLINWFLIKNV